MNRNRYVIIFIGMLCLGLLIANNCTVKSAETKSKAIAHLILPKEQTMSMKKAIAIAYSCAREWSKNAKLTKVISTDAMDSPTDTSGESGKRVTWNLMFTDPESTHDIKGSTPPSYNIFVSNGKIAYHREVKYGNHKPIDDSDLTLDSSDAVAIAKTQKGLEPGKDWAIGYHFNLEYMPLYKKAQKECLVIEVIGLSPRGNFAVVDIGEKTGKIVDAREKTHDTSGNAIWINF